MTQARVSTACWQLTQSIWGRVSRFVGSSAVPVAGCQSKVRATWIGGAYLLRFQYLHSTFLRVFLRVSGVQRNLLQMPMPARSNAQTHWFCKA